MNGSPSSGPPWSYADAVWPSPLSNLAASFAHFGLHLRHLLNPRRSWPYYLLALLPVLGSAGLARLAIDDASRIGTFFQQFAMRALALCALGLGVGVFREDADSGALPMLLLRPRAVVALPVGRWLAVSLFCILLGGAMVVGIDATLFGTPFSVSSSYFVRQVTAVVFGAMAYAGVFMAIGAWFKSGTGFGLAFLLIVDLILATQVESLARLSPAHYLSALVQTLPGKELAAAQTADQIPGALLGLVGLAALGCVASVLRLRMDPPGA